MNPVLPQQLHNNSFLRPQENKDSPFQTVSSIPYRDLFPNRASYGPLIPPIQSNAGTAMGNSNSCNDIHIQGVESRSQNGITQQSNPQGRRSNLSALLDQQGEDANVCRGSDEADSASGPSHLSMSYMRSGPAVSEFSRHDTPPPTIPYDILRLDASNEPIAKPRASRYEK
jgi:hypothetical protein